MRTRSVLIIAGVLVVLIGGWAIFRPELLFVDRSVDEAFPAANDPLASDQAFTTLLAGSFRSVAHETTGTTTIYRLAGGRRVLRLTDFETSNGPDLRVLLVAAADASDHDTVVEAGFVELGRLKGNVGDQNYDIPADVDLDRHRAVTIWCSRFGVNFGTAPLREGAES